MPKQARVDQQAASAADAADAANSSEQPAAQVAPPAPSRIPPVLDADGAPVELNPPFGGRWLRDADGGLSPADEATATAAGLAWPG